MRYAGNGAKRRRVGLMDARVDVVADDVLTEPGSSFSFSFSFHHPPAFTQLL
jgi:hypothetical protein